MPGRTGMWLRHESVRELSRLHLSITALTEVRCPGSGGTKTVANSTMLWKWGEKQNTSFEESQALLSSPKVLVHYDPGLRIVACSDASSCGIGSVLSHRLQDGGDKPIAYASRSLSDCENKYFFMMPVLYCVLCICQSNLHGCQ